jgi:hypothetical protein
MEMQDVLIDLEKKFDLKEREVDNVRKENKALTLEL